MTLLLQYLINRNSFLEMLETIDDDVTRLAPQVSFVKIDNEAVAKEYGLPTDEPSLVFFEDGLPK